MATDTVNESRSRASTYEYVIEGYEEQRDQLHALAYSLLTQVEPKDPKNPEDGVNHVAWRLAQVMYDMLSDASLATVSRQMLMDGIKKAV